MKEKEEEIKKQVENHLQKISIRKISTAEEMKKAVEMYMSLKIFSQGVRKFFDSDIEKAFQLHRSLCTKKKNILERIEMVEKKIKHEISSWFSKRKGEESMRWENKNEEERKIYFRPQYKYEIENIEEFLMGIIEGKIPVSLVQINSEEMRKYIGNARGNLKIPGLKVEKEKKIIIQGEKKNEMLDN